MSLLHQKAVSDLQTTSFSEIPVIDLTNIRSSDHALRLALAKEIRNACLDVGFFCVKNHGITDEIIDKAMQGMKEFFDLPTETKMEVVNKKSKSLCGYIPLLSRYNPNNAGDLHEGFQLTLEENSREKEVDDRLLSGGNFWPSESDAPNFRKAVLGYYYASLELGRLMFPIFALALELPEDYFEDKTRSSAAIMKLSHYPPQTPDMDERIIGIGAHTDWQCFTILWQQPGIQSLQVLNADNQWIDVPPTNGTLVINIGDQFARWTNDVFKSTMHRAYNRTEGRRYSMPLFFGTDYDVKLEPIPSCVSEMRPAKYDVITAGEHVKRKFQTIYLSQ